VNHDIRCIRNCATLFDGSLGMARSQRNKNMNEIVAPAIVENLDPAVYHVHGYSSNSSLKPLPDDPETYWALNIAEPKPAWAKRKRTVTRAMELGTAFHSILLEGHIPPVIPQCLLASNGVASTKTAKAWIAENPDYLKRDEYDNLMYAHDRCLEDPAIKPFLETKHRNELSLFWQCKMTDEFCRARLDRLCEFNDGLWIFDLKFGSADPDSEREIGWKILDMGYQTQAAMYWDAVEALIGHVNGFVFLFCRNSPPYDAYLWELTEGDLQAGRDAYWQKLVDLRRRRRENDWRTARFGSTSFVELPHAAGRGVKPTPFSEFLDFQGES